MGWGIKQSTRIISEINPIIFSRNFKGEISFNGGGCLRPRKTIKRENINHPE